MGERKCGFDGCNALEFRTTGYCLRHKDDEMVVKNMGEVKESTSIEWILFLVGIPISLFGYRVLQVEPMSHWFENLINPIVQICGIGSLLIGVSLLLSPVFAKVLAGEWGKDHSQDNSSGKSRIGFLFILSILVIAIGLLLDDIMADSNSATLGPTYGQLLGALMLLTGGVIFLITAFTISLRVLKSMLMKSP